MRRPPRVVGSLVALGVGGGVGILGAFVQAVRSDVLGVTVPWGAVLVLAVLVLVIRGAVAWTGGRLAGWVAFAGWLAATVLLASEGPWGDIVVSSGTRQFGYLLVGVIMGSASASIAAPRPDPAPDVSPGDVEQESRGSGA